MVKPSNADYLQVFQNPLSTFLDPELQYAEPARNKLGLPSLISGNFAVVCRFTARERRWAVRAFSRDVPDIRQRYDLISAYLDFLSSKCSSLVGFRYIEEGIRVNGRIHPIVIMDWVAGKTLDLVVQETLDHQSSLEPLVESWVELVSDLENLGIAHGDLQHGNILVDGTTLRLVDYDGMYVPTMVGMESNEGGHPNYQHPDRANRPFDARIDRFSAFLIYTALKALSCDPSLRFRYELDNALLFRRSDLLAPEESPLFDELRSCEDTTVRDLASKLFESLRAGGDPPSLSEVCATTTVISSSGDTRGWWKRRGQRDRQESGPDPVPPNARGSDSVGSGWIRLVRATRATSDDDGMSPSIWINQSGTPPSDQVKFVASFWRSIYHLPTCPAARHIEPRKLVGFGSVAEAEAWDYQPCKTCRPNQQRAEALAPPPPGPNIESAQSSESKLGASLKWNPARTKEALTRSSTPIATMPSMAKRVEVGSTVKLRHDNGKIDIVRLASADSSRSGFGQVAANTPLGTAIKGARAGQTVRYRQFGRLRSATILEVL